MAVFKSIIMKIGFSKRKTVKPMVQNIFKRIKITLFLFITKD